MATSQSANEFIDKKRHALVQSARKYFHNRPASDLFQAVWQFLQDEVEGQYQLASLTRPKLRGFASNFIGDENGPGQDYWPLSELGQWQQEFEIRKLEDFLIEVMALVIVENGLQKASMMWRGVKDRTTAKSRPSKKHRASDGSDYGSERMTRSSTKETVTPIRRSFSSTAGDLQDDTVIFDERNDLSSVEEGSDGHQHIATPPKQKLDTTRTRMPNQIPKSPKGKARADSWASFGSDVGEIEESNIVDSPNLGAVIKHVSFTPKSKRKRFSDHDHYFSDSSMELGSSKLTQRATPDADRGRSVKRIKTTTTQISLQEVDLETNGEEMEVVAEGPSDSKEGSPHAPPVKNSWRGQRDDRSPTVQRSMIAARSSPLAVSESITLSSPTLSKPSVLDLESETIQVRSGLQREHEVQDSQKPSAQYTTTPQRSAWPTLNPVTPVSVGEVRNDSTLSIGKHSLSVDSADISQSKSTSCESHLPSPPLSEHSTQGKTGLFDLTVNVPYSLDPIRTASNYTQPHLPITVSSLSGLPNMIMTYLQNCIDHNIRQAEATTRRRNDRGRLQRRSHSSMDDESETGSDEDDEGQIDFPLLPEERQYCRNRARILAAVRMDLDRRIRQMSTPIPTASGTIKAGEGFEFWFGNSFTVLEDDNTSQPQNTNSNLSKPQSRANTSSTQPQTRSTERDTTLGNQSGLGIVTATESPLATISSTTAIDSSSEYEPDTEDQVLNSNSTYTRTSTALESKVETSQRENSTIKNKVTNTTARLKGAFGSSTRKPGANVLKTAKAGAGVDMGGGDVMDLCLI